MPTPSKGESEQDFMQRCMAYGDMQKYKPDQRAAICHSKFRSESMHPDFQRIIGKFLNRFPTTEALQKFYRFIERNSLNITKAYNPAV